ncbi:MAG TPA: hypothetical protein GYA04_01110 [Acholeplasma sp.]|nr:hypothetical protein [Acholeplasma sp.]
MLGAHSITIEEGYQVRVNFLSYDNYGNYLVVHRTNNLTGIILLNEELWQDYQYIAFNISSIVGNTDLLGVVEETGLKLTLSKFDEILIEHKDNLEFIQGYWNDHTLAPRTLDATAKNFVASTPISKAYFENIESFTVEETYMVRVIYIDYSYNQYKVMLRTNTMTGTVLMDEAFWGNYQYIALNISKSPASNIEFN